MCSRKSHIGKELASESKSCTNCRVETHSLEGCLTGQSDQVLTPKACAKGDIPQAD